MYELKVESIPSTYIIILVLNAYGKVQNSKIEYKINIGTVF